MLKVKNGTGSALANMTSDMQISNMAAPMNVNKTSLNDRM
jgi:hypothetical protein